MALTRAAMLLALGSPTHAVASGECEPCFSIPYFTVDATSTGKARSDDYAVTATVGEIEIDVTVTNNESHSVATGFWSFLLTEPLPPVVFASDGDFDDRIEVSWEIVDDRVGPPVTDNEVLVYRNGSMLTTLPLAQTQYQDFNVFPGEEYDYAIVPANELGRAHLDLEVGFLDPNGIITGSVETPNRNPVRDVKVVLTPNLGRSALFDADDYAFFPKMLAGLEASYTAEGWFRSIDDGQQQTMLAVVDSATTRTFLRIGFDAAGRLRWEHRGADSDDSDVVTSRVGRTDGEWHHFAAVLDDADLSMTLYIDGRIVAESTAHSPIGEQLAQLVLGKRGASEHSGYFRGRLDDLRLWSAPRIRADIRRDMDRTLEGDEEALQAYWKFDEVRGDIVYDLTANDNDGVLCDVERSEFIAPVFVSGVTDIFGNYAIKGIYYGAGTTFTATPTKTTPIGRALRFDGVDDHIAFDNRRLDLTGSFTVEGWFKHPGGAGDHTILAAVVPGGSATHLLVEVLDTGQLSATFLAANVTTGGPVDDEFWYHYAVTYDQGTQTLSLYLDGEPVGSAQGPAPADLSAYVIGRRAPGVDDGWFAGWLDEIRVWDYARTPLEVRAAQNQVLAGTEAGLVAYWKLNEGDGLLATDAVATSNGDIAGGAEWVDDIPLNEVFTNTFSPESRQVSLSPSNTSVDRVDFVDISQIPVSGFVRFAGTACVIDSAEILVNGRSLVPPRFTDDNGKFVVEFEPGASGQQLSVKYKEHEFAPGFIPLPRIIRPLTGLFFDNLTKRQIDGSVVGGTQRVPIAHASLPTTVSVTSKSRCFEAASEPDEFGRYVLDGLPPVVFDQTVTHPDPRITFLANVVDVQDSNDTVDYVYRAPPEVTITGFPEEPCANGDLHRVMEQRSQYALRLSVFETYVNLGDSLRVPAGSGDLTITDNISGYGQVTASYADGQLTDFSFPEGVPPEDGHVAFDGTDVIYTFVAGFPNVATGGEHGNEKSIEVVAADAEGLNATATEWTVVTGSRARAEAINFVTTLPALPFLILREPPGDGSVSFLEQGRSIETTMSLFTESAFEQDVFTRAELGFSRQVLYGQFVLTSEEVEVTAELEAGLGLSLQQQIATEQTFAFTATETFTTAGEGDVFVGGALNMLYGLTDVVAFDTDACAVTVTPDLVLVPGGFETTFLYSESFILDNVIPELLEVAEFANLSVPPDPLQTAAAATALQSVYLWNSFIEWNNLLKGQPAGLPDLLPLDLVGRFASELQGLGLPGGVPTPPPPPIPLPPLQPPPPPPGAPVSRNFSFDAGAQLDYTEEFVRSNTLTVEFNAEIEASIAAEAGVEYNGAGVTAGTETRLRLGLGAGASTTVEETTTIGYTLADDDPGDNFTVDVRPDVVYGTPVFNVVGGVSSCPWQPGTIARDNPELTITPALQVDVDPSAPAAFDLSLANLSQSGEDRDYGIRVVNESNPDGATIAINGIVVESLVEFGVAFQEVAEAVVTVLRGPGEYVHDDLELQAVAPCEADFPDFLRTSEATFSARYTVPCSEVAIAAPEDGWLVTAADGTTTLPVTLNGYDRSDANLERLEVQYRPATGGDWFVGASVDKADLTDDFVVLNWDISPGFVPDGDYQVRAVAVCGIGRVPGVSAVAAGTIDRAGPSPLGPPSPGDGVLEPNDAIAIRYDEDVLCAAINVGAGDIVLTNTVLGVPVDFEFTCGGNEIVLEPSAPNAFLENQTFRAQVGPVADLLGNPQPAAVEWEFQVDRNPLAWQGLEIDGVVIEDSEVFTTQRLLVNTGGSPRSFDITDIPSWLTVSPRSGTIQPGSQQSVTFTVDGPQVGAGSFLQTVFASGTLGDEPRTVDVRVLCPPPAWGQVNPAAFQHSMSVTATLSTDGELSADEYDRVGVFLDGQLRGLAQVQFVPGLADLGGEHAYQVFSTIYGNGAQDAGRPLEIRVWDASACQQLGTVLETYEFAVNANHGAPTLPATITATSQITASLEFPAGWTWFSLNLTPDDLSTNAVLAPLAAASSDLVRDQTSFSQFVDGAGWVGTLGQLRNETMHLINLAAPASLEVVGYAVDPEVVTIPTVSGWNWIGFLPQESQPVDFALSSLPSKTGDLIKSQFAFAQYVEGVGWIGSLRFMNPALGYQLRATEAGVLAYPFYSPTARPLAAASPPEAPEGWAVDARRYPYNMALMAVVEGDGAGLQEPGDVVASFVDGECRGVGQTVFVPSLGEHVAFVMVYADAPQGDVVEFRLYDASEGAQRFVPTWLDFQANAVVGSLAEPLRLESRPARIGDRGYVPDRFGLGHGYPNPFNPSTKIGYGLPEAAAVQIEVFNLLGQRVRTLVSGVQPAGYHYAVWDGRTDDGHDVPSGTYLYVMRTAAFRDVRKVTLLK